MPRRKLQPVLDVTEHYGLWLALDPKTHQVLSHDPVFKKAYTAAKRRGVEQPVMHGLPDSEAGFIGMM